jgi:hypothetical protein
MKRRYGIQLITGIGVGGHGAAITTNDKSYDI